jgi:hypothetical protein
VNPSFASQKLLPVRPRPLAHLAVADWDYSWLLRTDGRGEDEFHLLPRCLAELAERDFDLLRVDAWPHLVAPDRNGEETSEFVILPQRQRHQWRGSREVRQVRPRDRLLRLAQAARDNGVSLLLTSWLLPDTQARRSQIRNPEDFVRIWHATLEWLREHDALSPVVALDFAHQFPELPGGYGAWQQLFHTPPQWARHHWRAPTSDTMVRINDYLVQVPQRLRTLYPQLHFGLSLHLDNASQVKSLDMSEMDFVDLHLPREQTRWGRTPHLKKVLEEHQGFCRVHRLQPMLGAGTCTLPKGAWLPDVCRLSDAAVDKALAAEITLVNPACLTTPQHPLWQEVAWLKQVNRRIRAS